MIRVVITGSPHQRPLSVSDRDGGHPAVAPDHRAVGGADVRRGHDGQRAAQGDHARGNHAGDDEHRWFELANTSLLSGNCISLSGCCACGVQLSRTCAN